MMKRLKKIARSKQFIILIGALLLTITVLKIKLSFAGSVERVTFESEIKLEGAIIRPKTPGPHPAIILLHGAGGSHQKYNKISFKMHANAFVKKGFAVLVYTKRGSGDNEVDYKYFTYNQLKNDAVAAVKFLTNRSDIDQENIGLMALSESGWFAPEVAAEDGNIRFIVYKVSSPFTVRKTVIHERKMDSMGEGFTEQEVEDTILPLTNRIWQFYIDVANDPSLANGPERDAINQELSKLNDHERFGKWFIYGELSEYDERLYAARGQNYSYDPLPFLKEINVPMLYVLGGKDKNIPTKQVVPFLEKFRTDESKDITLKVYPNASHYLNRWGLEDGPWSGLLYEEGYLELISSWATEQIK